MCQNQYMDTYYIMADSVLPHISLTTTWTCNFHYVDFFLASLMDLLKEPPKNIYIYIYIYSL